MKPIRVALCQIAPVYDYARNIERAFAMIEEAAAGGADLVSLPEMFYYPYDLAELKKIGDQSKLAERFAYAAKRHEFYLCTGSFAMKGPSGLLNTSMLFGPSGETVLSYSKCHLFEMRLKEQWVRESSVFVAGDRVASVKTDLATMGILICYDIRFPEMGRRLALGGAELILVPAVFNTVTGPAHWHLLNRARAVENQVFIAATSQGRATESRYIAYGHSIVVAPWGDIVAEAGEGEEIVFADLDPRLLEETRKRMPLLKHRRAEIYGE
jgi:omega-amidase